MSSSQERAAQMSFVERHGLWSDEQFEAAAQSRKADRGAQARSRAAFVCRSARHPARQDGDGRRRRAHDAQRLHHHHDAACQGHLAPQRVSGVHRRRRLRHAGDGRRRRFPDDRRSDARFRVLPWAPQTGWVLCDLYFQDGKPVPFSTRHLYRSVLQRLAEAGFDYIAGLEVEFHVFKLENPRLDPADATWPGEAPEVSDAGARAISISPRRASIRSSRSWKACAATWSRSACRCARSRSSSGRANANSPSIRRSAWRRPTR